MSATTTASASASIEAFLRTIFGDATGVFRLPTATPPWTPNESGKLKSAGWSDGVWWQYPAELHRAAEWAAQQRDARDVYVRTALFKPGGNATQDRITAAVLTADLDPADPTLWLGKANVPRPAICWESSPEHYQAIWLPPEGATIAQIEATARAYTYRLLEYGADPSGWDVGQVLRIPSSYNHKRGVPFELRVLWSEPERRLSLSDLIEPAAPDATPEEPGANNEIPEANRTAATQILEQYDAPRYVWELVFGRPRQGDRSRQLYDLERNLVRLGMTFSDALTVCRAAQCNKFRADGRPDSALREDLLRAYAKVEVGGADDAHQPEQPGTNGKQADGADHETGEVIESDYEPLAIDAKVEDLRIITAQAWAAIGLANARQPFLFRHGGIPSRIEPDDHGRPVLRELTPDRVRHELARAATFFLVKTEKVRDDKGNVVGESKTRKVVLPPQHVCHDVLATPDPPLPIVNRITECPTFAADGTLQTSRGYNPASRTYCAMPPGLIIPAVAASPDPEDVQRARRLILDDLLGDFPFASQADKANAVALGLLPFVRDMIPGPTPNHLLEAPIPGTGKGLAVEALLRPSCGRSVGAIAQAKDDDEWRKRITSMLRDGLPAILLDNITKPLDSGSLAMALTIEFWTDRMLGQSSTVRLPVRCAWVTTANNPSLSTEIARRTIRIRMDPVMEKPWEREDWRHPELLSWVDDNRATLVWAFLTLTQAWIAAKRPKFSGRSLGSYERWSHIVGGILETAGIDGFLGNSREFYERADVETAAWGQFVLAWWEQHRENEVGTSDLFDIAQKIDGIDLGTGAERSQRTKFGKALGSQEDRVYGDYRITRAGTLHRASRWRLMPTELLV